MLNLKKKIKKNTCTYHYQNLDDMMIYSSWDIEQNILKLVTLGYFLPFYPPKKPQNQNFEKSKHLHILHMCTKNQNIWCTVLEIQSETDIIFCHFGQFFALLPTPHPPNDPKNQNFEKKIKKKRKKFLEILSFYTYMCTINEDHMIYGSWNIRCNRQKFLSFWAILCPFSPLITWKIKILKLKKTPQDIIILHICTINDNHMIYGSSGIERNRHNFLSFWTVFCPFTPPMDPENQNFEKM